MTPWLHHIIEPAWLFGAFGTVAIFSLVFKENKIFRLFEHIFIGLATGYSVQLNWTDTLRPLWWDPMVTGGQWGQIFILPFCALFYTVYSRRNAWLARLAFGVIFGATAGTAFQAFASEYLPQVQASFKPILPVHGDIAGALNNLVFVLILICVSVYFFFAFEQKNIVVKKTALAGRWMLMIAFGATFGATIMTREALLIDRIRYLLFDWLQLDKIHHL